MNELKSQLIEEARAKGICIDGYKEMRSDDTEALVEYYIQNPDWCLERDYPTLRTLKEHFSDIEDRGVFVGKTFHGEVLNDLQTYIFHKCKGTIKVGLNADKGIIPMLYVANGCRMRIVGVGNDCQARASVVPVYSFGSNDLSARDNRHVTFKHYHHELI